MKATKFLFKNGGQGWELLRPYCWSSDHSLLTLMEEGDHPYTVHTILIPLWMDPEEYAKNYRTYLFAVECGYREEMGEQAYRQFCSYPTAYKVAVYELLSTKTFRSVFRRKLRFQLDHWLGQKDHQRRYEHPLSMAQFQTLLCDRVNRRAIKLDKEWRYRHNFVTQEEQAA